MTTRDDGHHDHYPSTMPHLRSHLLLPPAKPAGHFPAI
jgi:hypothetical protein